VRLLCAKIADAVIEGRRELEAQQKDSEPEVEEAGEPEESSQAVDTDENVSISVPDELALAPETPELSTEPELVAEEAK
jgi:small subunit ribosomal protein S2